MIPKKKTRKRRGLGYWIFRRTFRHWRTGKLIVAPPGKSFRFWIAL